MHEQTTDINKKVIKWTVIVIVIILGLFLFATYNNHKVAEPAQTPVSTVASEMARRTTYICDNNFSIDVNFTNSKADLTLSDGRKMALTQTPVAVGVQFTNADGSFLFLTKGPSASITENGVVTHVDCIEPKG